VNASNGDGKSETEGRVAGRWLAKARATRKKRRAAVDEPCTLQNRTLDVSEAQGERRPFAGKRVLPKASKACRTQRLQKQSPLQCAPAATR
jgi:hypothetical protein